MRRNEVQGRPSRPGAALSVDAHSLNSAPPRRSAVRPGRSTAAAAPVWCRPSQLVEALGDVLWRVHGLLADLEYEITSLHLLVVGRRAAFDVRHHDSLGVVLELEALAQLLREGRHFEPQRLGRWCFFGVPRSVLVFWGSSVSTRRAILTVLVSSWPLRRIDDLDLLVDRRVGDDARQIAHLANVFPVELDDDVPRLQARRLGRALLVDAGDQRAFGSVMPRLSAMSSVTAWMRTPSQPRRVSPNLRS